ncbi:MAG: phosphotransferase [Candidatus Adiutrix sp.]|jgi:Ser/Thr protein kinase RdoA (MazF antagonist)|nr:phosphotransferase [Candidatus Adiutrix sp.]
MTAERHKEKAPFDSPPRLAGEVARRCFGLEPAAVSPLRGGRVNETFLVETTSGSFVLQRLNDFFQGAEALGSNWLAVQNAARERDPAPPPLPLIQADLEGRLLSFLDEPANGVWRLTGYLPGAPPAAKNAAAAREAARFLGRCHQFLNRPAPLPLEDLPEGEFTNQRLCRADDFENLARIYRGHPCLAELETLLAEAADSAWQLPFFPGFIDVFQRRDVIIHGDPKRDNFLFLDGRPSALLDWDTVGFGHVLIDLAEMLRSWSARAGPAEAAVMTDIAAGVMAGYAETGLSLYPDEIELLPPVLRGVALNLCRRYLTDALAGIYFKWDNAAYPSLYEQNRSRASAMLLLSEHLLAREMELSETLRQAYEDGLRQRLKRSSAAKETPGDN